MRKISMFFIILLCSIYLNAQEDFQEKYGYKPKIVTLSNGKYEEFHDNDTIVEIGSAIFNTKTGKVVGIKSDLLETIKCDPEIISRWMCIDPMAEEYSNWSPYVYAVDNPIIYIDPDGMEPIKPLAGTATGFGKFMNNLRTGLGKTTGSAAHNGMLRMGKTKLTLKGPMPANTAPFNTSGGNRYIYTKKGGWMDMAHFMFYAGRAYEYKLNGEEHPAGKSLKDGLVQEMGDLINAEHSAFSYEDLPSDKFGAIFGAEFFDPDSELTFAEQLVNFLNDELGATNPEEAPNYENLPEEDDTSTPPTETNPTSTPLYIEKKEEEKKE